MFDLSYYFYKSQGLRRKFFPELSSYFNSYDRVSPLREEFIARSGRTEPGLTPMQMRAVNKDGSWVYIEVKADNYPKLHEALGLECARRNVERPACYIDTSGEYPLAYARSDMHAIFVTPESYNTFTVPELRALMAHELKHLYQRPSGTAFESQLNEFDCDAAAAGVMDYATLRSYVHKAAEITIVRKFSDTAFRKALLKLHDMFPNFAGEWFPFKLDKWHPSPASRMKSMRDIEPGLE